MVSKSVDFIKDLASPLASDILTAGDFALSDIQASLSTTTAVKHAPQTISYVNDNTANQNSLMTKMDELISHVKDGKNIYMDGKEVGRTVDRHLGQNTQLRSRTSWA